MALVILLCVIVDAAAVETDYLVQSKLFFVMLSQFADGFHIFLCYHVQLSGSDVELMHRGWIFCRENAHGNQHQVAASGQIKEALVSGAVFTCQHSVHNLHDSVQITVRYFYKLHVVVSAKCLMAAFQLAPAFQCHNRLISEADDLIHVEMGTGNQVFYRFLVKKFNQYVHITVLESVLHKILRF